MKTFQKNREAVEQWDGLICPTIAKIIRDMERRLVDVSQLKVQDPISRYHAIMVRSMLWIWMQLTEIPCKHNLSAIYNEKLDEEDFVAQCYHVSTYRKVHAEIAMSLSKNQLWGKTNFIPLLIGNSAPKSRFIVIRFGTFLISQTIFV